MTWAELTQRVRYLLDNEHLKGTVSEAGAFDTLARLLRLHMPGVIAHPEAILGIDKSVVAEKLGVEQCLSGPVRDMLDVVYRVLLLGDETALPRTASHAKNKVPKLKPLAECLSEIFEQFFNCSVSYSFEKQPVWLKSVPDRDVYDTVWEDVSVVYAALVDHRWTLTERLEEFTGELKDGRQRVDIWFEAPLNFMVEFDETQHFNPFRLKTLQSWDGYAQCSFDYDQYVALAAATQIPAGSTGFQKLKNYDPLFPPLLEGDAQDNRIRQRAFRDFLKDITPLVIPSVNPTIRINYVHTQGRIKDFIREDLQAVQSYILQGRFLDKVCLD